jgi:hypothetical protein
MVAFSLEEPVLVVVSCLGLRCGIAFDSRWRYQERLVILQGRGMVVRVTGEGGNRRPELGGVINAARDVLHLPPVAGRRIAEQRDRAFAPRGAAARRPMARRLRCM